ncbi:hypothetical protein CHU98_g5180 [Xylaria longipes]|nr:hypothetical protein CHU98_g5180 [Xylaria longipes]
MPARLPTQTHASAGIMDHSIDLVALSNKKQLNNKSMATVKSQPKPTPYREPVILKALKNPQGHLWRYYKLTTSAENRGCEHDLQAGFGDIWSAYKNHGYSLRTSKL